jgi:ribonuclease HII
MIVVGVDENGLGPRLGPMLVTAMTADANEAGMRLAVRPARGKIAARLGDSKKLVSYDDSALGEAWARALVPAAATPDDLVHAMSLDTRQVLKRACPSDHLGQCWTSGEVFAASSELTDQVRKDVATLESKGLRLVRAEIAIVCTRALNEEAAKGISRFTVDLHTMERLVLSAHEREGAEVTAICGKVGGYDRYGDQFGPLSRYLHMPLVEGRARSEYRVPGVGTLAFVRDADASSALVGLASLIGKWARDLLMARVVRYHREVDASLPDASGYHDPVTTKFIEASALSRKSRGLPDRCFERVKAARDVIPESRRVT